MIADYDSSIVCLTRAEADALLDPSKATLQMLEDPDGAEFGHPYYTTLLGKLGHLACEAYSATRLTTCISVDDGDDYQELGIYNSRGLVFEAEPFTRLNEQEA